MSRKDHVFALLCAATIAFAGCGDPPLESGKSVDVGGGGGTDGSATVDSSSSAGDAAANDAVSAADAGAVVDAAGTADSSSVQDAAGAVDAAAGGDSSSAADAPSSADAGSAADAQTQADSASSGDAGAPVDAGPVKPPCKSCAFNKQPTGNHPGAKGTMSLLAPQIHKYGSGFGSGYKEMRVWMPLAAGSRPVLFFVHGFNLYKTGGLFSSELGHAYKAMLEHVAKRGYIVAFVRVQAGATSCDHKSMAQNLVDATTVLFKKISKADKTRVMFAGHSMGAKIALLATRRTINQDPKNEWVDPQAVLLFNLDNAKPPLCSLVDARKAASELQPEEKVRITFVHTDDDKVSPWGHKTNGAMAVYDALKLKHRQFILLNGTGKGDANPVTKPELHDDHAAPLTVKGKIGGIADLAMPDSYLDGLDWYGYWKVLVGALDFHYSKGDAAWAYGSMRTHGGVHAGKVIQHKVLKQGW